MKKSLITAIFATLLLLMGAWSLFHAAEKSWSLSISQANGAAAREHFPFKNQIGPIALGLMAFKAVGEKVGADLIPLPSPNGARRLGDLPEQSRTAYVVAARGLVTGFAVLEWLIVLVLLVAACAAICGRLIAGFRWLFIACASWTLLGALFPGVHILVGARDRVAYQVTFWTFCVVSELASGTVLAVCDRHTGSRTKAVSQMVGQGRKVA